MQFKNVKDNENLIARLENVVKNGSVSHAYIFEGDNCVDKKSFAESFAKGILCHERTGDNCGRCSICRKIDHGNYEDLIYISGRDESIKDAAIIDMQQRLKTKPFGSRNIVIIDGCDTMTARAQNRLLKTLEEPPGNSVLMLLSENIENMVQTIQSRCVKYRINYFGSENYDFMLSEAESIVDMTLRKAPFYKIKAKVEKITSDQEKTAAFLDGMQLIYRNLIVGKKQGILLYKEDEIIEKIYAVENARKKIRQGVSPAYAIKNLILKIGG